MIIFRRLFVILILSSAGFCQEYISSLNLQAHYDIRRDHPTITQEYYGTDKLGSTFFFMDINFDHMVKKGGASDFYFEFMRYFKIGKWKNFDFNITVQYDDGSTPVERIILGGINVGNIRVGPVTVSSEFLLKKDYKLDINWQYTVVWISEFLNGRIFFNGFLDYWANDTDNPHWPAFDPEYAASHYSFQAEPQIGLVISPHWRLGSEIEIDRGFLGSVTGELAKRESYKHDQWYLLPTLFIQYYF